MKIGVPKETQERETRVAITPTIAKQLKSKGFEIIVESGAGEGSSFSDGDYTAAGAVIGAKADAYECDVVAKVNPPTEEEAKLLKAGSTLISTLFAEDLLHFRCNSCVRNEALLQQLGDADISSALQCSVCKLSSFQDGNKFVVDHDCGHALHKRCFEGLGKNPRCPLCDTKIWCAAVIHL